MLGSPDTILVVGGGASAQSCVAAYREAGGDAPILVVSADDRLPYFRPAVSKEYLTGEQQRDDLPLIEPSWYPDHGIEVLLGTAVTGLDLSTRVAATSLDPIRWGRCVLATGSTAASLPVPGGDDASLLTIRSAADTERLLARIADDPGPVAVIGSGFVGCEVAAGIRGRGLDVTVVSAEERPQQDRLGEPVGALIEGWLADCGVRVLGGRDVASIDRHGDAYAVRTAGAETVEAAHVVVAVGARPLTDLAGSAGLDTDDGIAVDPTMATAADGVFAVGDIARAHHGVAGRWLRVEHWGDAVEHGRLVGLALAGAPEPWRTVPGFWSTIAGQTIKYVAWGDGHDEVRVRRSASGTTVRYGRDGRLVGVLTHDHDDDNERAEADVHAGRPMPA
ncbi:MAG: FAD-dependent oxidoreductase [Ilumatobacteraceae bacterium]